MPYNVYVSDLQEGVYTKIAENITEPSINIESPDTAKGGEKFIKVAEVNNAGEGFLSKPVKLTFIGDVPKPEILQYFYNGFFIQYKNAAYATEMNLQASINGGEFQTVDSSNGAEKFVIIDNITGPVSFKTLCNGKNSVRTGNILTNLKSQTVNIGGNPRGGAFRSVNGGETWETISGRPYNINVLLPLNNSIFLAGTGGGIDRSTDAGLSWSAIQVPAGSYKSFALSNNDTVWVANNSSQNEGLYRSSDAGHSWGLIRSGYYNGICSLGGNNLVASAYSIEYSTDAGNTWNDSNVRDSMACFAYLGNNIILAGSTPNRTNFGIKRSVNGGIYWENTNIIRGQAYHIVYLGNNIVIALMNNSIKRSIDNGLTWGDTHILPAIGRGSLAYLGYGKVLCGYSESGSYRGGLLISNDYGLKWTPKSDTAFSYIC